MADLRYLSDGRVGKRLLPQREPPADEFSLQGIPCRLGGGSTAEAVEVEEVRVSWGRKPTPCIPCPSCGPALQFSIAGRFEVQAIVSMIVRIGLTGSGTPGALGKDVSRFTRLPGRSTDRALCSRAKPALRARDVVSGTLARLNLPKIIGWCCSCARTASRNEPGW